jgi:hypothetical protein
LEKNTAKLTDRDIKLLHLLGKVGVLRTGQAKLVYGDVKRYHLRRIEKLSSEGMIVREYGYIRPTASGLQAANYDGVPIRLRRRQYEERVLAVDVLSSFPDCKKEYAIELKRRDLVERKSQISAVITKGDFQYGVYALAHIPKPSNVIFLHSEMHDLQTTGIERFLVFYTARGLQEAFGYPPIGIKECCLLPYPAGVTAFKRIFTEDFRTFINQRFPGLRPSRRPFAHFEWQDKYITVLHSNDLVKRQALIDYLTYAQKRESRPCIIVCPPSQAQEITDLFHEYETELIIDDFSRTEIQIQEPSNNTKTHTLSNPAYRPLYP